MKVLFGNKKGGVGKSITVINLAGAIINRAKRQGKSTKNLVCLVDADTNETVAKYIARREEFNESLKAANLPELDFIKVEIKKPDMSLTRDLISLGEIYEYVLVDTGGYENIAFKSAIGAVDMVYLPFQSSQADMEQLVPTLYVIQQIEENLQVTVDPDFTIDSRLLLTKVDTTQKDLFAEAKSTCKELLEFTSISGCAIPSVKAITQIQPAGLTLSDPLPSSLKNISVPKNKSNWKPHPKRSAFDLLLDEIDGKRNVEFDRILNMSDASDTTE